MGCQRHAGKILAVIGASEFQDPLIRRARELGCTVHAFAWECGDVGERTADVFHPVSTAEKEEVLRICRSIRADGVCTIGSDFNNITATWVANQLGLPANSERCVWLSTNKHAMRKALVASGDPSPRSIAVRELDDVDALLADVEYPVIVKPSDRSGSRGITKLENPLGLHTALRSAWDKSFEGVALVEGFLEGDEFSVECFSWRGNHRVLQVTRKFTTGAPHYIETAHLEPPMLDSATIGRIKDVVLHALQTLEVWQGASHAEIRVNASGEPWIVEIASRMGGDFIGSSLVQISTGIDYVGAVIDAALGVNPDLEPHALPRAAAVRFVFNQGDAVALENLRTKHPELVVSSEWQTHEGGEVTNSSERYGWCVMAADTVDELLPWLPPRD